MAIELNNTSTPHHIMPVILCGGSGSRLWPLSREAYPKQFLVLSENKTLFQQAIERLNSFNSKQIIIDDTLIVTNEEHRFLVLDQLAKIQPINFKLLLEPESKNTAPALTFAALHALKDGHDPILVVSPADQVIKNSHIFIDTIQRGINIAMSGAIVVLGISPLSPQTGFGYIKQKGLPGGLGEFDIDAFVEKPNIELAKSYMLTNEHSWNSGIFLVRASVWIEALRNFRNDILSATQLAFKQLTFDGKFIRPDKDCFKQIPNDSIDYAVIEKCPGSAIKIKMLPLDAGWNDLGSWDAVWQMGRKDENGNILEGDAIAFESKDNLIYSSHRLIGVVGVNNLAIIETPDAVMVTDRNKSQSVKQIVDQLKIKTREEHILHRKVYRPWGWYDTIDVGENFKVKRIFVNPGASLSLQKHSKRAEHWVVIRGNAEVICGDNLIHLKKNESTFIPEGKIHRLSNPCNEPLEIIEVQSGDYVGEDDIVRIDDIYGRAVEKS